MDDEIKSMNVSHRDGGGGETGCLNILHYCPPSLNARGPSVLLLPFWGGTASTFVPVLSTLARKVPDATAFAVSYRGTGKSPPPDPEDSPELYNVPALADDVLHLLQGTAQQLVPSGRLIICAHSMSAKVSIDLLQRIEETKMPIRVEGIVLLGPAPPGPFELPTEMQAQQLTAYETEQSADWVMRNVLSSRQLSDSQYAQLVADCVGMSSGAKRGWLQHGMKWSCIDAMANLSHKPGVTVIVGAEDGVEPKDRVMSETVQVFRAHGFKVTTRIEEGCGHLLPVEAPEVVAEALERMLLMT